MKTLELQQQQSSTQTSGKMNGDIVKDIHMDEKGRIWMAVFPTSITIHSDKYPKYEWFHQSGRNNSLLPNDQITSVIEDSDGDIWVATSNGIAYYNTQTREWKSLLSNRQQTPLKQNHVFISLCEATRGTILVGGYMSGMYRINKKDMKATYFSPQDAGYTDIHPDKYIRSIYRDEEGTIWAGGHYNFKRIDLPSNYIEHYQTDYPITVITSKNEQELWVGTVNGIYKFNKKAKRLQQVNLSLEIGSINSIWQQDSTLTYIGTHGTGLWIYNNQTGKLKNYHTKNSGLISNNIFSILPGTRPDEFIISTENEYWFFDSVF